MKSEEYTDRTFWVALTLAILVSAIGICILLGLKARCEARTCPSGMKPTYIRGGAGCICVVEPSP